MGWMMEKFGSMMKAEEEDMSDDYEDHYIDGSDEEEGEAEAPAENNNDDQQKGSEEVAENTEANAPEAQEEDKKVHFVLFKPETFDKDITTMADRFIEKDTLILNMEQTNKDVAKRIIDFLGGVAYAHSGKISRVAEDTYIVMPSHIDITGDDLMDEVESDNVYF